MVWSEVVFCWVVVWGGVSPWASVSGIWVGDVSVGIDGGAVSGVASGVSVGWFSCSTGVGVWGVSVGWFSCSAGVGVAEVAGSCVVVIVVVWSVSAVVGCVSCPRAAGVFVAARDVAIIVQRARCFMCFVFMV